MTGKIRIGTAGLIGLFVVGASAAMAAEPVSAEPQIAASAPASPFGEAGVVGNAELEGIAGQADVGQSIQAENNSTVSRNSVSGNSVTGTIAFDAQAFQNLSGLSVLSANTGNNVAINSSLNVNVAIHP